MTEKVAVIGGGVSGLVAAKVFVEDGFEVTGYETRPYFGGLWKENHDSNLSVQPTTMFNSSKFRIAFSDFPFPESVDTYPTAPQIHKYLESYADHFDIRRRYQLGTRVNRIFYDCDHWVVDVTNQESNVTHREHFDRVCVATGTFFRSRFPKLSNLENFNGRVLHSIDFHEPEQFQDQNVLLVGLHATAQDLTGELSRHAKHVYLSHRSGLLLAPRFLADGRTLDTMAQLPSVFIQMFAEKWIPKLWFRLVNMIIGKESLRAFGDLPVRVGLSPAPSLAVATPLMADVLVPFLESGFAEPIPTIKQICGPNSIELTNGRVLNDIDTIIYCTGYDMALPDNLIPKSAPSPSTSDSHHDPSSYNPYPHGPGTPPHLYRNTFPMTINPKINHTLAFLGHAAVPLPGFTQQELHAWAISQTWLSRHPLPSHTEMLQWHKSHLTSHAAHARQYGATESGTYYPVFMPFSTHFPWLNNVAGTGLIEHFGGKFNGLFNWRCWRLWWRDREMYDLCTRGVFSPTIYRVFDIGGRRALEWEVARGMLKRDGEVWEAARLAKKAEMDKDRDRALEVRKEKSA